MAATFDAILDICCDILHEEAKALRAASPGLDRRDVDLVVRIAKAAGELVQLQLDPLGARGRKALSMMSDKQLEEMERRLQRS